MINVFNNQKFLKGVMIALGLLCALGVGMRFYHITHNDFFYYDEGYYMNHNRYFMEAIDRHGLHSLKDYRNAAWIWLKASLATGKALWFLLTDSRVFFGGVKDWFFPKLLSAIAGSLTLWMTFLFARRFFNSVWIGLLSAGLLAIFPSHLFYSRLALQEAFSTLCFISGFYFYVFPRRFGWRTFLSAAFLAAAFFTNYRLITLPVHITFCELFLCLSERRKFDIRKYVWHLVTFFAFIFIVGNIDNAQNTKVTFAWMFYQAGLAKQQVDWINLFSFPYYLFRLESVVFAVLFFGNVYYVVKRKWVYLFPFLLACLQMFIYSFAGEKGARYVCVVTPFMTMAVGSLIVFVFQERKETKAAIAWALVVVMTFVTLFTKAFAIVQFKSDYRTVMEFLLRHDPNAKVISTQNYVQNLYVHNKKDVASFPYKFRKFKELYAQGYRYLIVDPQAYVSWAENEERFNPNLKFHLGFIDKAVKPVMVFDHFNDAMLERFVFEHNENLKRSLEFLNSNDGHYGKLRLYDMGQCLAAIDEAFGRIRLNPKYKRSRLEYLTGN